MGLTAFIELSIKQWCDHHFNIFNDIRKYGLVIEQVTTGTVFLITVTHTVGPTLDL